VAYTDKFRGGSFIQWYMVAMPVSCPLFVTSKVDVIFMFPNQRFGEAC